MDDDWDAEVPADGLVTTHGGNRSNAVVTKHNRNKDIVDGDDGDGDDDWGNKENRSSRTGNWQSAGGGERARIGASRSYFDDRPGRFGGEDRSGSNGRSAGRLSNGWNSADGGRGGVGQRRFHRDDEWSSASGHRFRDFDDDDRRAARDDGRSFSDADRTGIRRVGRDDEWNSASGRGGQRRFNADDEWGSAGEASREFVGRFSRNSRHFGDNRRSSRDDNWPRPAGGRRHGGFNDEGRSDRIADSDRRFSDDRGHQAGRCNFDRGNRYGDSADEWRRRNFSDDDRWRSGASRDDDDDNRPSECRHCGRHGHLSRQCPNDTGFVSAATGGRAYSKDDDACHVARNWTSSNGDDNWCNKGPTSRVGGDKWNVGNNDRWDSGRRGFRAGAGDSCRSCGEAGHYSRVCPNRPAGRENTCYRCNEPGHLARDCPNEPAAIGGVDRPRPVTYEPEEKTDDEVYNKMHGGINFDRYETIPVQITSSDQSAEAPTPTSIRSFEEAGLPDQLMNNVRRLQYQRPTPIQGAALPCLLDHKGDVMAVAQTGSGKTAAFLLPILARIMREFPDHETVRDGTVYPLCLVVAPTRELAVQISEDARALAGGTSIFTTVVYGGTSVGWSITRLRSGCHVVVATAGRLVDLLNRGTVVLSGLKFLVLDEADRMLDMGFEPAVRNICNNYAIPVAGLRQTLMFSATFPEAIQQLARDFLHNYFFIRVGVVGGANTDITQHVLQVNGVMEKRDNLVRLLKEDDGKKTLVFVEKKRACDFLASFLCQSELPATSIHGDREQRERHQALADFHKGNSWILVATNVAARGLDIPDVRHVINYDLPADIQEYIHRIGRTGRCGNQGKATSFFEPTSNADLAGKLVKVLAEAQQVVPDWLEEISSSIGSWSPGPAVGSNTDCRRAGQALSASWTGDSVTPDVGGLVREPTATVGDQPPDDDWE